MEEHNQENGSNPNDLGVKMEENNQENGTIPDFGGVKEGWISLDQAEEDYETDFTFGFDEEEDQLVGESTDSESEYEDKDENDISQVKRQKKPKTIFSMDMSQQSVEKEGDLKSHTSTLDDLHHQHGQSSGDAQFRQCKRENEQVKRENATKISKPAVEDCSKCYIKLPYNKRSTLTLLQRPIPLSSSQTAKESIAKHFIAKINLENPTDSLIAFKIYCNISCKNRFRFTPASGLIPSHGRTTVHVMTKLELGTATNDDYFTVKFFPAYFATKGCDRYIRDSVENRDQLNVFLNVCNNN